MNIARTLGIPGLAALAATLSPVTFADSAGWYAGFNAGQSRADIDDKRISDGLLLNGFTSTSISDDTRDLGFKLFGGYEFNRHFSLEGGYFDLGRFGFTTTTVPLGSLRGDARIHGLNLDGVGTLPLTDTLSVFARLGANYAETRDSFSGTGSVAVFAPSLRQRGLNYKFGFGAQYAISNSFGLRVEAERYRVNDGVGNKGDVDLLSAGLVYRFGRHAPAPVPAPVVYVAPPEPVAAPAPVIVPPPAPPPPPPPPVRRRVSFSADSLFDFARDTVRPAGKQELERFAQELKGAQFDTITVTGYTDRIGSEAYNQKLSTRRAEAVRDYLVQSTGIPTDKITTRGAAGSDPVTKPGECQGQQRTPKLIACLQPDRRVDVEVTGTRLQAAPGN